MFYLHMITNFGATTKRYTFLDDLAIYLEEYPDRYNAFVAKQDEFKERLQIEGHAAMHLYHDDFLLAIITA